MKIAIASMGPAIHSDVGTNNSRYLLMMDFDTMEYVSFLNPLALFVGPMAKKILTQLLQLENVEKLLTSHCSPSLLESLGSSGVQVVIGATGTVRNAVQEFKALCTAKTCVMSSP